jgi:hypothetical protein
MDIKGAPNNENRYSGRCDRFRCSFVASVKIAFAAFDAKLGAAIDCARRSMQISWIVVAVLALCASNALAGSAPKTVYTLPQDIRWLPDRQKPPGSFYAILRKAQDGCGELRIQRFPDGFTYPMHVNNADHIFTVLKGTLVIGFDKRHLKSAERFLPAGSVMQGLVTEPHYGRAIGDTVFEVYGPPCEAKKP